MAIPVSVVTGSAVAEKPDHRDHGRVLIVDDDAEMRTLLRRVLESDGHRVKERDRGTHVLAALRESSFDLTVLDKEMPGMTGFDVLPLLRREFPRMRVLLITAFGGRQVEASALRLGATRYLEKPFQLSRFREVVEGLLADPSSESQAH
jgi:DNA-binding NtrC family response regulator